MAAWPTRLRIRLAGAVACAALLLATTVSAQDLAPIPALDTPVVDTTATLDAAARARLEAQALELQQRKGSQLQVLVVPTTQPEDIAQYAVRVFDQWRLGREGVDDGVLLLVAKDDRRVRIEVGYGLEGAIPDATASRVVQEYLVPRFREGDYAGGIEQATGVLVGLVDGEPLPPPMADSARERGRSGGGWILALFAAVFVAQFVRAIFGRAPRPFRGLAGAAASGGVGWLLGSLATGLIGGVIGLLFGLAAAPSGRFARSGHGHAGTWGGMGGGHWGGGGFGGGGGIGGGGGWSGGGGMSGGGGASGSW